MKNLVKKIIRKILRIISKGYCDVVIARCKFKRKTGAVRVGFIVQLPSIWDKQVDIYEELKKNSAAETFMFVVPPFEWDTGKVSVDYTDNYFVKKYPEAIKVYNDNKALLNLKEYDLDYLFYPRPYDHYLPKSLRSSETFKYTKCCYVPYGLSGADVFNGGNIKSRFFDYIAVSFMDSEYMEELMKKQYRISSLLGIRDIKYLGYPVLRKYLEYPLHSEKGCITWTPRWSTDSVIGGSNFVKYSDDFLKLTEQVDKEFIFRPHPLMFDEMITKGTITEEYKQYYLKSLENRSIQYDTVSPIDEIFKDTEILITDYSSIIPHFLLTGRPIIYCDGGISFNPIFSEMSKYIYVTRSWHEVEQCLKAILNGNDEKLNDRIRYIQTRYPKNQNPARMIACSLTENREEGE